MEEVFKAKRQLLEYLQENPHLKPEQERIEKMLKNAGSSHNRIALLTWEMQAKTAELGEALLSLQQTCKQYLEKVAKG